MSTERIKQLHEQATERYLTGDYEGALQCWRDVLGLDPKDEQALGGLRLASQFVVDSQNYATGTGSIENELDRGLTVLDSLGGAPSSHGSPGASDRRAAHEPVAELDHPDMLSGWELPPDGPSDDAAFGAEAFSAPPPSDATGMSAAAAELSRRVKDLLGEANAKFEAGDQEEALGILARLAILDEDNAEAAALRAKIESASTSELDKVEHALIEGVAALEADSLDDAERYFNEALALAPEHREAQHYLEKVAERRARHDEELLDLVRHEAPPPEDAVPLVTNVETAPRPRAPQPVATPAPAPAAPSRKAPRATMPPPKFLIWGGVAIVVLAGVAVGLPYLVGGISSNTEASNAAPSKPRPKKPKAAPAAKSEAPATGRALPRNPEEAAKLLAAALAKGRELLASGDYGGAVVAFNDALSIDAKNAEAQAGLEDAGERYKTVKAEQDTLNKISMAFRDGEYSSGLRMAYRLPPTVSKSYADAVKVAGWYNMAVVALRAGECREALSHLDEALAIDPNEADAKKLKEFASRYVDAVKDRAFLARVDALTFLPLPTS